MSDRAVGWWVALSRLVLEPSDFEGMILPALADALHEQPRSSRVRWRLLVVGQLVRRLLAPIPASLAVEAY